MYWHPWGDAAGAPSQNSKQGWEARGSGSRSTVGPGELRTRCGRGSRHAHRRLGWVWDGSSPHRGNHLMPRATRGAVSSATSPCSSLRAPLLLGYRLGRSATVATRDPWGHAQPQPGHRRRRHRATCRGLAGQAQGSARPRGTGGMLAGSGVQGVTARCLHGSRCLSHRSAAGHRRSVPPGQVLKAGRGGGTFTLDFNCCAGR